MNMTRGFDKWSAKEAARRGARTALPALLALATVSAARAEVRVQDVAVLKGQRTNRLMGFGLVTGLNGKGDAGEMNTTRRALIALHRRFEQPVLDIEELDPKNTALVAVEASIPQFGAREGQTVDVVVSALNGSAKSLKGGQLLLTPLQDATLTIPDILAFAGGRVELTDPDVPTRGIIRGGATIEEDFFYNFIEDGHVTLVLHDSHAGWPMAQLVARAINQELVSPALPADGQTGGAQAHGAEPDLAVAIGPKNVRVRIPPWELPRPAWFVSQVLQTPLFVLPYPQARVVINRTRKSVSLTGNVTISPTVLLIPGLGTVTVGGGGGAAANPGVVGLDTQKTGDVNFQELMNTLSRMKLTGDQLIDTIEQLQRTGTLHAQVIYEE